MVQRGLIITAALCLVVGVGAWATGMLQSEVADAAEAVQSVQVTKDTKASVVIDGFRSAKFGMTEGAVRAAISTDFGVSGDDIKVAENPVQRTTSLTVRASDLIPETGQARVSYIFGYKSKALIQVNVLWGTAVVPETTGVGIARTALILKNYFDGQAYDPKRTIRDRRLKNGALIFQSTDQAKHLVRLIYLSVPLQTAKSDAKAKEGDAAKAAKESAYALSLNYISNPESPDILRIKTGEF